MKSTDLESLSKWTFCLLDAYVVIFPRPKKSRIMCTPTRVAVHADERPGMSTQLFCEDRSGSRAPPNEDWESSFSSPLRDSPLCTPVAERVGALLAASRTQWPDLSETGKTLTCETLKTTLPQALEPSTLLSQVGWGLAARKGAKHILTKCVCGPDKAAVKDLKKASTLNVLMEPHTPLNKEELRLVSESVRKLVPWGWDNRVDKIRDTCIPNGNGTLERSCRRGGNWVAVDQFHNDARLDVLDDGRTVTVFGQRRQDLLRPLHESLYESLSRFHWLKQGDFTPADVVGLTEVSPTDEMFISGDYTSSTDHIKSEVLRIVTSVLLEKATVLSDEERWALQTYHLYTLDGRLARRGSPMGSYLSFPILCLVNRVAFDLACTMDRRLSARERVSKRCLINGDDVLFRGDRHFALLWKKAAKIVGFLVNDDKTGISKTVAELNSTAVMQSWEGTLLRVPRIPVRLVCGDVASSADYASIIADAGLCPELTSRLTRANFGMVKQAPKSSVMKLKGKVQYPLLLALCRRHIEVDPVKDGNYFAMLPVEEPLTFEVGERERLLAGRIDYVRKVITQEASSPEGLETRNRRKVRLRSQNCRPGPLESFSGKMVRRYVEPPKPRKALMEFAFLVHRHRRAVREREWDTVGEPEAEKSPEIADYWFPQQGRINGLIEYIRCYKKTPPHRSTIQWGDDGFDTLEIFE